MADYTMEQRIEELERRKQEALHAGTERSIERQQEKGKLLARERIDFFSTQVHSMSLTCLPGTVRTKLVWKRDHIQMALLLAGELLMAAKFLFLVKTSR